MWRFYWVLICGIPKALWNAVDLTISASAVVVFFLTLLNRRLGERLVMSWHAISPWWSLVPVAMILIYGLMRSNYEHYCHLESGLNQSIANVTQENSTFKAKIAELEKQLQSKTDLSEKEIQILAAAVEGLASDCAGIIILNPQLIFIGTICLSLGDTIERTEYQEAIDSLVRDEWIKQHGSRYEPTVKGWNKGKEILASEEGKAMMLELHRKFPAT